jgi:flagellar basal body-associated protein FliL
VKLGKKAILGIGIPLGIGVAAGLVYVFVLSGPSVPPAVPDPAEGQHGMMIALEDKVVNLMKGGDYRYAKVGVTVELRPESADFYKLVAAEREAKEKELVKEYDPALPLMADAVGRVVGAHTSSDLATPDGRAGLKTEMKTAMGEVLGSTEVIDIYFTDLVMQ